MGTVYMAEDTKLKRTVALKFLPPQALAEESDKARFVHEAQAAAALHHPNICTVFEINETDDQVFISMAHLPGGSLKEKIEGGPLTPVDTLKIAAQIARGLGAAHSKQIVHRDIKPTNIMFSESGAATVMDFGLAKSKHQTHVTRLGTTLGTIAYMSPEQSRGVDVDHRTDIWSLGVMMYEMVTGERPFKGDYDEAVIYSILNEPPKPISEVKKDINPDLAYIIDKAMAKSAGDRYQTAEEMLEDIEALLDILKTGSSGSFSTRSRVGTTGAHAAAGGFFKPKVLFPAAAAVLVVAVAIILMVTGDKGGVTETVAVVDEDGQTIERVVPKSEYRKNFALFTFDNKTGDSANDWVEGASASLLEIDLLQDQIVNVAGAYDPTALQKLRRAGFTRWSEAPWNLKRRIAKESQNDFLVTGTFTIENGEYVIDRALHNANTGRMVSQKEYRGPDLFAIVDDISLDLKVDLLVPEDYLEDLKDLPVAEMMTTSTEALEAFGSGIAAVAIDQDWVKGVSDLQSAVAADSTFAFAHWQLMIMGLNTNQSQVTEASLSNAMQYLYKLPERIQFVIKSVYYQLKKDPVKQEAVLKMMCELYPEDILGPSMLAQQYAKERRTAEAIEQYEKIFEIDPSRSEILRTIGQMYRNDGEFDKALEYYTEYAELYPTQMRSFTPIAQIYRDQGDYDKAMQYYDKALLIEPENVSVLVQIGQIDALLGNFDEGLRKYNDALQRAKSPSDRLEALSSLSRYYRGRGQMQTSFEYMTREWAEEGKVTSPVQSLLSELMEAHFYVVGGEREKAFETVESVGRQIQAPYDEAVPLGYVFLYLEVEEPDSAEAALERLMAFIEGYKLETLRSLVYRARGEIAELRGDFKEAIVQFEKRIEATPRDYATFSDIGRCYRKLGDLSNAEANLRKTLRINPVHAECLYELALVQAEKGEREEALASLSKALDVWEPADPEFEPARKARDKLLEWQSWDS
jgi:tetratricopeptide (TPR) repeat protein